jgi:hypothetical protein
MDAQCYFPIDSNLQFYLLDVTPVLGWTEWADINIRRFSSCHHPAITMGKFLWKQRINKFDNTPGGGESS